MRSLRSGLIVSFVITHLNTALCMHAAGVSYRVLTCWPDGARLAAAMACPAVTKVVEAGGWKNMGFRMGCGGVIALTDAL